MSKSIKYLSLSLLLPLFCFSPYLSAKGQGAANEPTDEAMEEESDESSPEDQPPVKAPSLTIIPAPRGGCTPGTRCMGPRYPSGAPQVMRYVSGIGWRKFSPEGARRKDWWDFKRTLPPFWGDR